MPSSHSPGRLRAVLCAALAVGCTLGQATRADSRDFLWKVSGATGAVYLVGSVHLLNKDFYPLSDGFETAFKESDLLVEEVDLAELMAPQAQLQMLSRGMLPPDQSLDKVVSPATFDSREQASRSTRHASRTAEAVQALAPGTDIGGA